MHMEQQLILPGLVVSHAEILTVVERALLLILTIPWMSRANEGKLKFSQLDGVLACNGTES